MAAFEWLPFSALTDARVERCLTESVALWARRWFITHEDWTLAKLTAVPRSGTGGLLTTRWKALKSGLYHAATDTQLLAMSLNLVDAPTPSPTCSPADTELLTRLATSALEDLAVSLAQAIGVTTAPAPRDNPFGQSGGVALHIGPSLQDEPALKLAMPASLLVGFRKSLIGSTNLPVPEGAAFSDAIGDHVIAYQAPLGTARLSIADLRALERGDVIRLDTMIADAFPVRMASGGKEICAVRLSQADGMIELVVADG